MSLFLLQFHGELKKLFARKRTYFGFDAFLLVEIAVLFLLNLPKPKASLQHVIEGNGYSFAHYFSGVTLALMMLMWTTFLLGALFIALVAGDVMAKEIEDETMRMVLCRPVSRVRIGVLKYLSCVTYTLALTFFIGLTALVAGILYHGIGGLIVFAPMEKILALYEVRPGLERYFGALPLLGLSLTSAMVAVSR